MTLTKASVIWTSNEGLIMGPKSDKSPQMELCKTVLVIYTLSCDWRTKYWHCGWLNPKLGKEIRYWSDIGLSDSLSISYNSPQKLHLWILHQELNLLNVLIINRKHNIINARILNFHICIAFWFDTKNQRPHLLKFFFY